MTKTKTKQRLFIFTVSILSGFFLSSVDYFATPKFNIFLQADSFNSQSAKNINTKPYDYELVNGKDKIIHLKPSAGKIVPLKIKNTGKMSWNINLKSSKNITPIAPGKTLNLNENIPSRAIAGFYTETITPAVADSKWTNNNTIDLGVIVDGDFEKSYQFELQNPALLSLMNKVTKQITLKIKNTGTATWFNHGRFPIVLKAADKFAAADFKPNDNSWLADDIIATMKEPEIEPGQIATFNFNMTAPAMIADYEFKFNLAIKDGYAFKDPIVLGISVITKKVALTFDDGYGDIGAFLDILNVQNIRGTFFMLGDAAEKNPDGMRRIVNEGHLLANHSYGHPDFRTLNDDQIRWQLNQTREYMKNITGKDIYPYFRYPYGAMNDRTNTILHEEGWIYFNWTQDTLDWHYHENTDAGRKHIYYAAISNPPDTSIVLMHTMSKSTVAVLPDIIQWYRDHGYAFITVDQL